MFKNSEEHQMFHERNSTLAVGGAWVFCAECGDMLEGTSSYNGGLLSQALMYPTQTLDSLVEHTIKIEKETHSAQEQTSENEDLNPSNSCALPRAGKASANGDTSLEESYERLVAHLNRLSYSAVLEYIDRRALSETYGEEYKGRYKGGAWIGRFRSLSNAED